MLELSSNCLKFKVYLQKVSQIAYSINFTCTNLKPFLLPKHLMVLQYQYLLGKVTPLALTPRALVATSNPQPTTKVRTIQANVYSVFSWPLDTDQTAVKVTRLHR